MLDSAFIDKMDYLRWVTIKQWLVDDYSKVNKGDDILIVKDDSSYENNITAKIVSADDDKYVIDIMDENDNVLDTYSVDPVSGTGTNSDNETVDLPQTGMSGAHKLIAGVAALMSLTGAVLVKKSRKEDEE